MRGVLLLLLVAFGAGCGRVGFASDDAGDTDAGTGDAGQRDGGTDAGRDLGGADAGGCTWGAGAPIARVDTTADELQPTLSGNGLRICFARSVAGDVDIFCADRARATDAFADPVRQTAMSSTATDRMPSLSDDGTEIFFSSNRPGGTGGEDIYTARYDAAMHQFRAATEEAEIDTTGDDASPELVRGDRTMYFQRATGGGAASIFVTTRGGAPPTPFHMPTMVTGFAPGDVEPAVAGDRTHFVFCTTRDAPGIAHGAKNLWCAVRSGDTSVSVVGALMAPGLDGACGPELAPDGSLLYDSPRVPAGPGASDVAQAAVP